MTMLATKPLAFCARSGCTRPRCLTSKLCEEHRADQAERKLRSITSKRVQRRRAQQCADCGKSSHAYRCFGCAFQMKLARCAVAALVVALVAACSVSTSPDRTTRWDAACAACEALCEWSARCRPTLADDPCVSDCTALVCSSGCSGYVADEMRLDACLEGVEALACEASDLPEPCLGVLR
jgi:hypothetical protein